VYGSGYRVHGKNKKKKYKREKSSKLILPLGLVLARNEEKRLPVELGEKRPASGGEIRLVKILGCASGGYSSKNALFSSQPWGGKTWARQGIGGSLVGNN